MYIFISVMCVCICVCMCVYYVCVCVCVCMCVQCVCVVCTRIRMCVCIYSRHLHKHTQNTHNTRAFPVCMYILGMQNGLSSGFGSDCFGSQKISSGLFDKVNCVADWCLRMNTCARLAVLLSQHTATRCTQTVAHCKTQMNTCARLAVLLPLHTATHCSTLQHTQ